jgi:outer membrane lipoprotein-sorting protein
MIFMDAVVLLREVSGTYRGLKTLAVEATIRTESGDENDSHQSEHRARFFYADPNLIRYESCGKGGPLQVVDGKYAHHIVGGPRIHQPRYTCVPVAEMHWLPHRFRADFPMAGESFLYQGIDERVAAASILREEDGCYVLSVTYEPSPYSGLIASGSEVLFWVNAENRIVMRQESTHGHRLPLGDEVIWSRHIVSIRKVVLNETLPESTFDFTPPPNANLQANGPCGIAMGGSSGFVEHGADELRRLEHRGSHRWEGDTLVDDAQWKIRGVTVSFERRLTFSTDEKELHIDERVRGPKGDAESSWSLPLKP